MSRAWYSWSYQGILNLEVEIEFEVGFDSEPLYPTGRAELACDVTLRSVSRVLRHAQNGYRYFSVDVVEWRDTSLRRRSTRAAPKGLFAPELPYPHKLTATDTAALSAAITSSSSNSRVMACASSWQKVARLSKLDTELLHNA